VRIRKTLTLDKRIFKPCEIKEKEAGLVRKKFLFVHFNGRQWKLLLTTADLSKVKSLKLE